MLKEKTFSPPPLLKGLNKLPQLLNNSFRNRLPLQDFGLVL